MMTKRIHLIGVAGTAMATLAAMLKQSGHEVSGSDEHVYPPMSDQLRALGIDLIEGFSPDQIALKPDVFVVGNVVMYGAIAGEAYFRGVGGERFAVLMPIARTLSALT